MGKNGTQMTPIGQIYADFFVFCQRHSLRAVHRTPTAIRILFQRWLSTYDSSSYQLTLTPYSYKDIITQKYTLACYILYNSVNYGEGVKSRKFLVLTDFMVVISSLRWM